MKIHKLAALDKRSPDEQRDSGVSVAYGSLPFTIVAMVVLPDHRHVVWTLPLDDLSYSQRIRLIKAGCTKHLSRESVLIQKEAN